MRLGKMVIIDTLQKYSIFFILILAILLRARGIAFGLPFIYDPDEPYFTNPALNMLVTGDLNPHWFGHPGSVVMYSVYVLWSIFYFFSLKFGYVSNLGEFQAWFNTDPTYFYLGARLLMMFAGVLTVYIVYLIGKKIFNKWVGILSSFLLAISPLHIQHSRYVRTDVMATLFILLSLYFLLRYYEKNTDRKLLILSSIFAGVSISAKYPSAIMILPIVFYCLDRDYKNLFSMRYFINSLKFETDLCIALFFIFIGLFITAPYVILDHSVAISNLKDENLGTHLGHERLPGIQNHIWYLKNALKRGIGGLFFEIFAGIGLFFTVYKKSYKRYLFMVFPIAFFLFIGDLKLRWDRWFIPLLPFEAILFAVGFFYSYKFISSLIEDRIRRKTAPIASFIFAIMLVVASVPTISAEIRSGTLLMRPDTRTLSKEWVENNLPNGSKIAYERYAPLLHINPRSDFKLMNTDWNLVISQPLSYYKNNSVNYILITSYFKDRHYAEPEKYKTQIARYETLKNETELIKIIENIENPGPVIEIYKI